MQSPEVKLLQIGDFGNHEKLDQGICLCISLLNLSAINNYSFMTT